MHVVAKENAYTYVFNYDAGQGTTPIVLHAPDDANISDLVLKKMGVTPKPVTAAPAPAASSSKEIIVDFSIIKKLKIYLGLFIYG
jgi:outer membrane protein